MMCISSPAGRRLARAKCRLDTIRAYGETACEDDVLEYEAAADALADELIAQGFADMEGD